MNLFVIGWNCSSESQQRAMRVLDAMHAAFPLLDPATKERWSSGHAFAAWMHVGEAAGPRSYVDRSDGTLTLFDGSPVDPSGRIAAHQAQALSQHWSEATEHLEGRFAAARLDRRSDTLEIFNDPFGLHPVFVWRSGDAWWIANSVRLLAGVAGNARIDLRGVERFVGTHFTGRDRTLVEGISILPAAQRWRWRPGSEVERSSYLQLHEVATTPVRSFGPEQARDLASALGEMLEVLSDTFGTLQCPITAGRDSRMLTALLTARGLPGDYFTAGDPDSTDVVIGTLVARRLGVAHRLSGGSATDIAEAWDEVSARMVQQFDGLVTLAHARNALTKRERLERKAVHLYGAAGELGRGVRLTPSLVRRPTLEHAIERTRKVFDRGRSLLRPEARRRVLDDVSESCRELHGQGIDAVNVPDAFDLGEYGRRWAGAQARQGTEYRDVVLPFMTRAYMRAAFATPAEERLLERVPFELLKYLSPTLHALPFEKPWAPQSLPMLSLVHGSRRLRAGLERRLRLVRGPKAGRARDRLTTFELVRGRWRRYLDRPSSEIWEVVDRDRFEHLTSDRTTREERLRHQAELNQVVTMLAFEDDLERWTAERAADEAAERTAAGSERDREDDARVAPV